MNQVIKIIFLITTLLLISCSERGESGIQNRLNQRFELFLAGGECYRSNWMVENQIDMPMIYSEFLKSCQNSSEHYTTIEHHNGITKIFSCGNDVQAYVGITEFLTTSQHRSRYRCNFAIVPSDQEANIEDIIDIGAFY